mgnify:FL=1|tara:strand:- start:323 stop:847 length:525 start_codon:yes stop_codon:yes gene_type:complete
MNLVEKIKIVVDDVTTVGSAFAATSEGEAVFINARIVNAVKIKHGDILEAHVLPNYEDKRASVPWRAMRASVQGSIFNEFSAEDETPVHTNHAPQDKPHEHIKELLEEHGPMRTATVARLMEMDAGAVGALCNGLFASGEIVRADVYGSPDQSRSSHRVWAINMHDFDEDPTDL